ncbi:MAG TPA: adenylate kinase [Dehalococcoidia bacterium]|nr:adenylate kinase [Dehalococcoidia bacterium]
MRLILLGPPGAGKGTQAARIAEREGLAHISTGDMFRDAVREGTELGKLAKSYMDRGELVPDDVTIRMLLERLRRPDARRGFVLDGFPRNVAQACALDEALAAEGLAIDLALHISVSDDELVRRLSGRWMCRQCGAIYHETNNPPAVAGRCDRCGGELYQRDDDRPDVVRARLEKQKPPEDLLAYYRQAGKLVDVNGEQDLDAVTQSLLEAINAGATR